MNMNRRQLSTTLLFAGVAGSAGWPLAPASAQTAGPVEGKDFVRVETPQPAGAPAGKVEVLELSSYA